MNAPLGRIISSCRGLVETCQQRAVDLEISRSEIDRLAGFTDGYAGKFLGNGNSLREKKMWPTGLDLMLGVLGLKILLIEDEAATAKTLALRTPVVASHQRFGNKCNSKRPPALEDPASVTPPMRPCVETHSHLRVVQAKRKAG